MIRNIAASATVVTMACLMSGDALAGFEAGVLIEKSPHLEKAVSHILVGRLNAFHEVKSTPGRYVAEVAVSEVEKGEGVAAGDLIYVRFTSPMTPEEVRTVQTAFSDCGDRKIDPLPGAWLRIYTQLNENFEYVADHPSCFFFVGRKNPSPPRKAISDYIAPQTVFTLLAALGIGFGAGLAVRVSSRRAYPGVTSNSKSDSDEANSP